MASGARSWGRMSGRRSARRGGGRLLGDRVVVGEQIVLVDGEVFTDCWVGEVEHVEIDGDSSDAASELERIDAVVDGVAEELGPRCLLLAGGIPDTGFALAVVPARSSGRAAQEVRGRRVGPWCHHLPVRCRRGAVATASATLTRRRRRRRLRRLRAPRRNGPRRGGRPVAGLREVGSWHAATGRRRGR